MFCNTGQVRPIDFGVFCGDRSKRKGKETVLVSVLGPCWILWDVSCDWGESLSRDTESTFKIQSPTVRGPSGPSFPQSRYSQDTESLTLTLTLTLVHIQDTESRVPQFQLLLWGAGIFCESNAAEKARIVQNYLNTYKETVRGPSGPSFLDSLRAGNGLRLV